MCVYISMDCWVCWSVVNFLLTVTCVSVSGVFGHDDAEGAHRQTSFKAVSVSARAPGSQLPWKGEGGARIFTLKFPRVVFLKENLIYFCFFFFSGANHCLGFSEAHVREGPAQGLHRKVCSELPAAPGSPQPSVSALRGRQRHRFAFSMHSAAQLKVRGVVTLTWPLIKSELELFVLLMLFGAFLMATTNKFVHCFCFSLSEKQKQAC